MHARVEGFLCISFDLYLVVDADFEAVRSSSGGGGIDAKHLVLTGEDMEEDAILANSIYGDQDTGIAE